MEAGIILRRALFLLLILFQGIYTPFQILEKHKGI
jgi:hypothetical protein